MRHLKTLLAAGVASAAIAPAPAQANDADAVLRLLNGFITQSYSSVRGEFRGRGWNADGSRRGWNDDDDDDGRRGGWNDDDDDGGRRGRNDDDDDDD